MLVTGKGAVTIEAGAVTSSQYTDNALDVDFTLTIGDESHEGEVTLVRDHEGDWWRWGSLDNWLDGRSCDRLRDIVDRDERDDVICEITRVTSEAAKGTALEQGR